MHLAIVPDAGFSAKLPPHGNGIGNRRRYVFRCVAFPVAITRGLFVLVRVAQIIALRVGVVHAHVEAIDTPIGFQKKRIT